MSEKKNILFVYATKENRKYIDDVSKKYNRAISSVINRIIAIARENKTPLGLKKHIPKYVERSEKWLSQNMDKDTEDTLKQME